VPHFTALNFEEVARPASKNRFFDRDAGKAVGQAVGWLAGYLQASSTQQSAGVVPAAADFFDPATVAMLAKASPLKPSVNKKQVRRADFAGGVALQTRPGIGSCHAVVHHLHELAGLLANKLHLRCRHPAFSSSSFTEAGAAAPPVWLARGTRQQVNNIRYWDNASACGEETIELNQHANKPKRAPTITKPAALQPHTGFRCTQAGPAPSLQAILRCCRHFLHRSGLRLIQNPRGEFRC
jgi:hypothetical protein